MKTRCQLSWVVLYYLSWLTCLRKTFLEFLLRYCWYHSDIGTIVEFLKHLNAMWTTQEFVSESEAELTKRHSMNVIMKTSFCWIKSRARFKRFQDLHWKNLPISFWRDPENRLFFDNNFWFRPAYETNLVCLDYLIFGLSDDSRNLSEWHGFPEAINSSHTLVSS